jgi:hypothetical protein
MEVVGILPLYHGNIIMYIGVMAAAEFKEAVR